MLALPKWLTVIVSICGGWWSLLSGVGSAALTVAAVLSQGSDRKIYALLAFAALWVFALRVVWKNYQMLQQQKPKFKISCGNGIPGCTFVSPGNNTRYFRLLVKTDGVTTVHKCRGYLAKIEKGRLMLFDDDRRDLPFVPSEAENSWKQTIFLNTSYSFRTFSLSPVARCTFA